MTSLRSREEYRDYLLRYGEAGPSRLMPPLTYGEFCAAIERWEREYHAAWRDGHAARMTELEYLLLLCSRHIAEPHAETSGAFSEAH